MKFRLFIIYLGILGIVGTTMMFADSRPAKAASGASYLAPEELTKTFKSDTESKIKEDKKEESADKDGKEEKTAGTSAPKSSKSSESIIQFYNLPPIVISNQLSSVASKPEEKQLYNTSINPTATPSRNSEKIVGTRPTQNKSSTGISGAVLTAAQNYWQDLKRPAFNNSPYSNSRFSSYQTKILYGLSALLLLIGFWFLKDSTNHRLITQTEQPNKQDKRFIFFK